MQKKRLQKPMQVSEYANSLITDMKSLSNSLKPISKNLFESNNSLLNQLLSAKQDEIYSMIIKVLSFTLQIVQYKSLIYNVVALLNKTITCIKTLMNIQDSPLESQQIQKILSNTIDVLIAGSTQHKDNQDTSLRVLQISFSLIDHTLIPFFNQSMLTRMFSIFFQFCQSTNIVQNISVSALFALVQSLFQFGQLHLSFLILNYFLQYLIHQKKFIWIKGYKIKGLVWDLSVVCIKSFSKNQIIALKNYNDCQQNLNKMYNIVVEQIFTTKNNDFYSVPQQHTKNSKNHKVNNKHYQDIGDFIRYFKAYESLSVFLSIEAFRYVDKQFISFRSTIPRLIYICELQRNSRMFIFLQAICELLLHQYDMPLALDKGMTLIEILSRISQDLCLKDQSIKVNWELNENYISKIITDQPKINDGDFVRLIKNTITSMRMKFQKDVDFIQYKKKNKNQNNSARGQQSESFSAQNKVNSKKWQVLIENIIKIIRYLSSLNFITDENEEDPTRKIILELQYWFLLCPILKAKNMILEQLLKTASVLKNKIQAIKVSQSVQIGSNILYGCFEDLNSIGLTIIFKMMAGIKADWEDGKGFQQLDQIYNLCSNIFAEQKLTEKDSDFLITIQALIQCANSLIADLQQKKQKLNTLNQQNANKRYFKMIQYLIQRLLVVLNKNPKKTAKQWNFITAFFITLCYNKNQKIKDEGIKLIGAVVKNLLKNQFGTELDMKKQIDILSLYIQLSKSQIKQIQCALIDQLKVVMPIITQEIALMDCFKVIKLLSQNQHNSKVMIGNIHDLQQILIRQCLFRITSTKYLKSILNSIQIKSSQKNEQYRMINLLWAISDYFMKITPTTNIPNQFIELWEMLYKNLWTICQNTNQCQTKQSAIHSITQILAQTSSLLPFDFIILIISKYYHKMVLLLLGISQITITHSQKHAQTAKVGLKNYIKILKKLIVIEHKSEQDKKQISRIMAQINQNITKYITKHIQNKNTGNITLQLLFQLANFIVLIKDDRGFDIYGVKKDLTLMLQAIYNLLSVAEDAKNTTKMDLKSNMYNKKLKPLLQKIKISQQQQIKEDASTQKNSHSSN